MVHQATELQLKPQFQHSSTLSQGEVRLFSIEDGQGNDIIEIKLDDYILAEQTDKFEAISYAWGSIQLTQEILCNGKPLMITPSLHSALWQSREDNRNQQRHALLWADYICIHQANLDEKTQQVRDMTEIYRSASTVVIWLGKEEEDNEQLPISTTQLGFQILQAIDSATKDFPLSVEDGVERDLARVFQNVPIPPQSSNDWRALGSIILRPWFSRVWILRELASARKTEMRIGQTILDAKCVMSAMKKLGEHIMAVQALTHEEKLQLLNYASGLYQFSSGDFAKHTNFPIVFLSSARQFKSTDPRDKIIALLGLTPSDFHQLADYNLSYEELITAVVKRTIQRQTSRLERCRALFRALCNIDTRFSHPGLPSWCGDFVAESDTPFRNLTIRVPTYITNPDEQDIVVSDDHNVLEIRGTFLDEVDNCIETPVEFKQLIGLVNYSTDKYSRRISRLNLDVEARYRDLAMTAFGVYPEPIREQLYLECLTLGQRDIANDGPLAFLNWMMAYEAMLSLWQIHLALRDLDHDHAEGGDSAGKFEKFTQKVEAVLGRNPMSTNSISDDTSRASYLLALQTEIDQLESTSQKCACP